MVCSCLAIGDHNDLFFTHLLSSITPTPLCLFLLVSRTLPVHRSFSFFLLFLSIKTIFLAISLFFLSSAWHGDFAFGYGTHIAHARTRLRLRTSAVKVTHVCVWVSMLIIQCRRRRCHQRCYCDIFVHFSLTCDVIFFLVHISSVDSRSVRKFYSALIRFHFCCCCCCSFLWSNRWFDCFMRVYAARPIWLTEYVSVLLFNNRE